MFDLDAGDCGERGDVAQSSTDDEGDGQSSLVEQPFLANDICRSLVGKLWVMKRGVRNLRNSAAEMNSKSVLSQYLHRHHLFANLGHRRES